MPSPLCPLCGESVQRIHRRPFDHLVSFFYPVRRYRCKRFRCGWEGTLKYLRHVKPPPDLRNTKR